MISSLRILAPSDKFTDKSFIQIENILKEEFTLGSKLATTIICFLPPPFEDLNKTKLKLKNIFFEKNLKV